MEIVQISDMEDILNAYKSIENVFPNLSQRVCIDEYLEKLAKNAEVIIIRSEQSIIGFLAAYMNNTTEKIAYISLIGVTSSFMGKGIGSKLFDCCVNMAKEKGMTKLRLEVDNDNISAIKFYEKHGMKFISDASDFSIYMERNL